MIPTSFLFKDIYNDRWGDPSNPNAVDVPLPDHTDDKKRPGSILARLAGLFSRRRSGRPNAWSFTIRSCID